MDGSGTRTWAIHDALGSVRQTLDDAATPLGSARYTPFGVPQTSTPDPFGFTGELHSQDLVYLRARWYDPAGGVFVGRDPFPGYITKPGSLHPYHYVYNNPVLWTDPTGHDLEAMEYFLWGIVAQVAYNNGVFLPEVREKLAPSSCDPFPMIMGRHIGNTFSILQGLGEIKAGEAAIVGGGALCLAGVGCLGGAALATAGAAVAAHGATVVGVSAASEIEVIVYTITGSSSNSPPKWQFPTQRKADQATRRGWANSDIDNVLNNPAETKATTNLDTGNSATVYYRSDGHYVVRDDVTGDIFHVSNTTDPGWFDPFGDVVRPR